MQEKMKQEEPEKQEGRGRGTRSGSRDEGKELTSRGILSQIELHQAGI